MLKHLNSYKPNDRASEIGYVSGSPHTRLRPFLLVFLLSLIAILPLHADGGSGLLKAQISRTAAPAHVSISLSVTEKNGRLFDTLQKEDIRVLEDGVPQEVVTFSPKTDQALSLAILFAGMVSTNLETA